jgi:hypothetical protein
LTESHSCHEVIQNKITSLERELTAANAKLAAYESVEVPEYPQHTVECAPNVYLGYPCDCDFHSRQDDYIDALAAAYRAQAVLLREAELNETRYLWLREKYSLPTWSHRSLKWTLSLPEHGHDLTEEQGLDAAIDAARGLK